MCDKSPDFSPLAGDYARYRPTYPEALFEYLASLVSSHEAAWDCATGNGQAAVSLAAHFKSVTATDVSAEQLKHAVGHERIEYRQATAEDSGLPDHSVDLITVASAVHWFDLEKFFAEAARVLRPGGALAVWTYHVAFIDPPFDAIFGSFYSDVLKPHFAPGARLVDDHYRSLQLPGQPLAGPAFHMQAEWTLEDLIAFMNTWSGVQNYLKARGEHPLELIRRPLEAVWGEPATRHLLRWPLFLRHSRL